jgi:hypothetical protein
MLERFTVFMIVFPGSPVEPVIHHVAECDIPTCSKLWRAECDFQICGSWGAQVLYELVESLRAPDKIEAVLKQGPYGQQFEVVSQRSNPFLHQKGVLYVRFVDTLADHIHHLKGGHHLARVKPAKYPFKML